MTARFMTSGLAGVLKMGERRILPVAFPLRLKILAESLPIPLTLALSLRGFKGYIRDFRSGFCGYLWGAGGVP